MVDRYAPPLSHDGLAHQQREDQAREPRPEMPYNHPLKEQQRAADTATAHRLEREEISVNSGKVAGHDFPRERLEHEDRCRERGY